MALKQCDKCGEMVGEAKAFCPGCGNAFVEEEKRQEASKFEKLDSTVQFGQTMYNQMLEDMGLKISDASNQVEKRVEVIEPVKTENVSTVKAAKTVVVSPAVEAPEKAPEKPKPANNAKWYIVTGVAAVLLLTIALVSALLIFFVVWSRLN